VECRYLTEGPLSEGSAIYIEEYLHGKPHKLRLHITKMELNSRIEYNTFLGTKGVFIMEPEGAGLLFTAEMHMGVDLPLVGGLVDRIMGIFMSRQLQGMEKHIREEGQNLKTILEQCIAVGENRQR